MGRHFEESLVDHFKAFSEVWNNSHLKDLGTEELLELEKFLSRHDAISPSGTSGRRVLWNVLEPNRNFGIPANREPVQIPPPLFLQGLQKDAGHPPGEVPDDQDVDVCEIGWRDRILGALSAAHHADSTSDGISSD